MPVPQENSLFVEQASCLFIKDLLTIMQHRKMPVPQENSLFVEQASCLFIKDLLTMMPHLISYSAT
ncbi:MULTISPECIES: hypothetical protein [unclassified Microcoleus]|uniref:hypothetical protein n=1 Tax=unclassified Microcoleus TaxID=2642155 RepID=UPI002FD24938